MRPRRPLTVSLAAAALAVAAPACGSSDDGKEVFAEAGCGGCHTLADAGAAGQTGPNLDILKPSAAQTGAMVAQGGGAMPSFSGRLSSDQIKAVAQYVEQATHR